MTSLIDRLGRALARAITRLDAEVALVRAEVELFFADVRREALRRERGRRRLAVAWRRASLRVARQKMYPVLAVTVASVGRAR